MKPFLACLLAVCCVVQLSACRFNANGWLLIDTMVPQLEEVIPVATPGHDTGPAYVFKSSEGGTILYGGICSSATTAAVAGNNTIVFDTLDYGVYTDCTIRVRDLVGNLSAPLHVSPFVIAATVVPRPLNDTGMMYCGNYAYNGSGLHDNTLDCQASGAGQAMAGVDGSGDPVPAGQDAVYGRDADPANDDSDGHAGFSFAKLDSNGMPLAMQNIAWSDAGSEMSGSQWRCVRDNVTGLVWETKTNDGGLRHREWTYTWYHENDNENGGHEGLQDAGFGIGSDNCWHPARCDTAKYVDDVNATGLCGFHDWRVPNAQELTGLASLDRISPAIDADYFPHTRSERYWLQQTFANNNSFAWNIDFASARMVTAGKHTARYLRLVRGGE